ncbi:uncharacterized protein F5Z01DRAFT_697201 [Emericellopsis atlantica]|uniref:FAD-binding domain-containing protein n=1 Tax=Emericellopsis atlantica TaxID=2614577 RepID=A0A9P7ZQK9_9HYPO|nr:uncharacterized protein F5Z01DRAFT_697201 [Emericellopsis atlantica]KAG9256519.1 hypothetical protein F5Z01DRAFT_697201 [Emericellopsis atlantica]
MGKLKVIIVGCGLSGALLGNGLARHDVDFEIYDRLEETQTAMATKSALERTHWLIQQIVRLFGAASDASEAPVIVDKNFKQLLDLSSFPNYSRSAPINRVLLRDFLCDQIKGTGRLHYGKQFTGFEIMNPGKAEEQVRVSFKDGTTVDCDLLIAADGNQSLANKQLGLNNIVTLKTHACFLTKNEMPFSAYRSLPKELLGSPILMSADGNTLYWCVYLPKKFHDDVSGQDGNNAASEALYDEEKASCMLGVAVPMEKLKGRAIRSLDDKEKYDLISSGFEGWSPIFHKALELCQNQSIHGYEARCGLDVPLNWREKSATKEDIKKGHPRVWLMGDSIHPMLPNRGMGGNTAMRDTAEVLPRILKLKEAAAGPDPLSIIEIKKQCQEYEQDMIPRAFEWVQKSGRNLEVRKAYLPTYP